ncbi:MAG: acyl-CoA dehydrogenase family protein, partial [Vulcanimicrobiaceae bacterium]
MIHFANRFGQGFRGARLLMEFAQRRDHDEYRAYVREFAARELAPHSKRWDAEDRFPWDAVKKMAEAGLTGVIVPK